MKKTFLFAALAALSMVSCTNNELPEAEPGYGYINVNVSNDPVVETRASQTVGANDNWNISATQDGKQYSGITLGINAVPKGTYVITAASHATEDAALSANNKWGAAYYKGTSSNITITDAKESVTADIACGKAKNARIKVSFSLAQIFTDYSITLDPSDDSEEYIGRNLVIDSQNYTSKLAYFKASELNGEGAVSVPSTISYTISYKYNGNQKPNKTGTITMGGPATEKQLVIKSNDNGTISVSVTYDNEFSSSNENLEFDAATGDEVEE